MLITQEMIWNRLDSLEKKLDKFLNEAQQASIEEISLNKACRKLHLGSATVVHLVRTGKLKARIYKDQTRRTRYRFLISDIKIFQKENKLQLDSIRCEGIESSEEIAKRIFRNKAV